VVKTGIGRDERRSNKTKNVVHKTRFTRVYQTGVEKKEPGEFRNRQTSRFSDSVVFVEKEASHRNMLWGSRKRR